MRLGRETGGFGAADALLEMRQEELLATRHPADAPARLQIIAKLECELRLNQFISPDAI
jgi:hypothetical protein